MLKVAFIGAGGRAQGAHYPNVSRLKDVSIEAVAELDESRMKTVVDKYKIPRTFNDYHKMLDTVELDAVYVIMGPGAMARPAIECMNAKKHIFIEKPAGGNSEETQQLLETAIVNKVYCMVGYQRRYAAVTKEAMRLVEKQGHATFAMGEFHKPGDFRQGAMGSLWDDICHVADLVRFMVGSDFVEVTAYQDAYENGRRNCFNSMIRFANRAVGFVTGCRNSGGRYLRSELHGLGVGCYMRLPEQIEILEDGKSPRILSGAEIDGVDPNDVDRYEGVLTMHEHFVDCIQKGEIPCSDIRDVIQTSLLVDQLAGCRW